MVRNQTSNTNKAPFPDLYITARIKTTGNISMSTNYIIMAYSASYMYKYIVLYYGLVVNVCMIANKNSLSDYYVFPYRCRWA